MASDPTPFSRRPASPALRPLVRGLHYIVSEVSPGLQRILPSGRVHLLVNLHDDGFRTYHGARCETVHRSSGAVLEGPAGKARVIDTEAQRCLVAVDFALGGAAAFFGIPLDEARDQLVDLDRLWGPTAGSLRERLLAASHAANKLDVMESVLLDRLPRAGAPDPALAAAARLLDGGISVADTSARIGVRSRTLTRRFRSTVGLTPKRFSRVRRLQRVVRSIDDPGDADWCDLAAMHGYVDQSHLVHDFGELAGMTPTAYRPHSIDARNHVDVGPA